MFLQKTSFTISLTNIYKKNIFIKMLIVFSLNNIYIYIYIYIHIYIYIYIHIHIHIHIHILTVTTNPPMAPIITNALLHICMSYHGAIDELLILRGHIVSLSFIFFIFSSLSLNLIVCIYNNLFCFLNMQRDV